MDEREVPLVSGGVKRRCGLGDVIADDRRVADLPVAQPQLVVGQADRPGIVRALGLLERACQEGNAARRLSLGDRQLAVQAPQLRQPRRMSRSRSSGGCPSASVGLADVVLQEPGLGQPGVGVGAIRSRLDRAA